MKKLFLTFLMLGGSLAVAGDQSTGIGVNKNKNSAYDAARVSALKSMPRPVQIKIVSSTCTQVNGVYQYQVTVEKIK